jgi:hypothetical protein
VFGVSYEPSSGTENGELSINNEECEMLNPSDTKKVRYEARYTKHEGLAEGHK